MQNADLTTQDSNKISNFDRQPQHKISEDILWAKSQLRKHHSTSSSHNKRVAATSHLRFRGIWFSFLIPLYLIAKKDFINAAFDISFTLSTTNSAFANKWAEVRQLHQFATKLL